MERKTICDGLRKHFWSAASASAHLRLLPLLVAVCCAWLPAAQAEGAGNTAEPSTPNAVDAALAEAGLLDGYDCAFHPDGRAMIAELYPKGGDVTISDLVAKGAVRKGQKVKVLGLGEISVSVQVSVDAFSDSARDKIVAAGGSATVL